MTEQKRKQNYPKDPSGMKRKKNKGDELYAD
jgi:hypothetical protein